jgi:hypothetical protein
MAKILIQYQKYVDYDRLERLNWNFENPVKDGSIYIAKLKKPLYMILPKSEILEIYEEPNTKVKRLKYVVNMNRQNDLVSFLDNMNSLCVELANINSLEWFKRELDKRKLVELYNRLYDEDDEKDEDGMYNTTWEIEIKNMSLLDDLMNYNDEELMNIMVCINGIEFYRQTFQWNITIEKVVEEMTIQSEEEEEEEEEEDEEEEEEEEKEVADVFTEEDRLNKKILEELDGDDDNVTKEMIENLETLKVGRERNENEKKNNKEDNKSRMEIESIISQKSEDIRRYMLNAERARRAADMMHQKAKYLTEELKIYEGQLKQL